MIQKQARIVIMEMSDAYVGQEFYRNDQTGGAETELTGHGTEVPLPVVSIDCRDISGTNGYCDDTAKEQIRERIADLSGSGIHFLDSGNYHYLSLLWLEKIREPFSLVLFDHHPDMQLPSFGEITSCGGWVKEALERNPFLEQVYLAGVDGELLEEVLEQDRIGPGKVHVGVEELLCAGEPRSIYISLDKDALGRDDARCDWDQGDLTLDEVLEMIRALDKKHRLLGMDVCGENPGSADPEDVGINDRTNRKILETFCALRRLA